MSRQFQDTIVLFSGGLDSTACVHFLRNERRSVRGIFFDYGQSARDQELAAVKRISAEREFPVEIFQVAGSIRFSVGEVFGRNAFLVFSAILFTQKRHGLIALGMHGGTPYFDSSPAFFKTLSRLVEEYSDGAIHLVAPFLNWTKSDIFNYFTEARLPLNLIYSCELGDDLPCGRCASCRDHQRLGILLKKEA